MSSLKNSTSLCRFLAFCTVTSSIIALARVDPAVPAGTYTQEQPVFRTGVDVVVVDVTVVDSDGNPIQGLTPQDFVVLVDGKARKIASLEFISRERTVVTDEPAEAPAKKTTHFSTNEGVQPGRLVLISVDRGTIQRGEGRVAMNAAAQFVDNLTPKDRVGLYTMPPGGPRVDFTFDHERIKEALGGVAGVADKYNVSVGSWNVGMTEALAIHRGDRFIQAEVFNRECWDPITKQMDPLCLREVPLQSRRMVDQARLDARNSILWMLEMVHALAYIEEPKTLVLISEGFLQDQETYGYFQEFARAAARARVNLYAIQFESLAMDASRSKASPTLTEDIDIQADGLANLAGMSGGAMFRATASGASAFTRVEKELTGYYLLSFEAEDNDRDGQPHEISVRLQNRSGRAIRAREEFIIPPEPTARTDVDRLADALREPFMRSDLPLVVATYNIKDSSTLEPRILVAAAIGTSESPPSEALVGFTLVDENGDTAEKNAKKVTLPKGAESSLPFAAAIPISPGSYHVRLAAVDGEGRVGSVEHTFRAQTPTAGELELSDLLLLDPQTTKGKAPLTSRLTTATRNLDMYLELYSRENDALQGVTVTFEIADDEKGAHRAQTTVAAKSAVPYGRWIAEGSVPLQSLPPDVYVARATVSKSGAQITKLTRPFRLEQGAATDAATDLEAIPEGTARSYAGLIDHYQKGQTIGAISTLNRMVGSDIAKALEVIEGIGLSDEKSKAAALLHTEVALAGNDEVYHLEVAREMVSHIENVVSRVAFQMRWLRAVGLHFWNLNRAEDALVYLEQANDLDPTDVETIIAVASIYETIGWVAKGGESLEQAESVIRIALKDDADNVEARLRLGHILKIQGRRDDALEELYWVLEATDEPNSTMIAHLLIGDLQKDKGLIDEAIESYKSSVDLDPLCQVAVTALSQALHQRGELEASRAVIDAFFRRKDTFVGKHDGWRRYLHGYPERSQALLAELREEIR